MNKFYKLFKRQWPAFCLIVVASAAVFAWSGCEPEEYNFSIETSELFKSTNNARFKVWVTNDNKPLPKDQEWTLEVKLTPNDGSFTGAEKNSEGAWTLDFSNLKSGTDYSLSLTASCTKGSAFGGRPFRTNGATQQITIPTVTTYTPLSVGTDTAVVSGTVSNDGGASVAEMGFYWSTISPVSTSSNKLTAVLGTGTFNATLKNLTPNTKYYYAAYATNAKGTGLGNELNFTTAGTASSPSVTTVSAGPNLGTNSQGKAFGNVTDAGGTTATITERGFVWSVNPNPTLANGNKVIAGSGLGAYNAILDGNGMLMNTKYHCRAYATNSANLTAYGADMQFASSISAGTSYQGGVLFYLFTSGDKDYVAGENHGLIMATNDLPSAQEWGANTTLLTPNYNTGFGWGKPNTDNLTDLTKLAPPGVGTVSPAAAAAKAYSTGGYSDWFLPSTDEMGELMRWASTWSGTHNIQPSAKYWVSNEDNNLFMNAWAVSYPVGMPSSESKSNNNQVRPIRQF